MKRHFHRFCLTVIFTGLLMITGCALDTSVTPVKVVLFAPFEGRFREIGYEMLYAARLAFTEADADPSQVRLIPIDDGGTLVTAQQHAAAIALDPQVQIVITAGLMGTHPDVLTEFGDLPVIVAGSWRPPVDATGNVFYLASAEAAELPVLSSDSEFVSYALNADVSAELLALKQVQRLRDSTGSMTIVSSASLPNVDFVARYQASDAFAPAPSLISTLAYDAAGLALNAISVAPNRQAVTDRLHTIDYQGINGQITFDDHGYWQDAPLHVYQYNADGVLTEIEVTP